MSARQFPAEFINNPQFMNNFVATMCHEISKKEKIIADGEATGNKIKENIQRGKSERKILKATINSMKTKVALLKPSLESLSVLEAELTTTLALISTQQDDKSLREKADINQFKEIVKFYKTTCENRRAEYEAIAPLASKRHKIKVQLQLMEVKEMMLAQKKQELIKLKQQRQEIDERRMQVKLVEVLTIASERAKMQQKLKAMTEENVQLLKKLEALKLEKEKKLKQKQEEKIVRQRAREEMPPPRLDMSALKAFGPTPTARPEQRQRESAICSLVDSDNLSINTVMLDKMCMDEEQLMDSVEEDDNDVIVPNPLARSISMICGNQGLPDQQGQEGPKRIETLEKSYSQLSLEKEDDNPTFNYSPIKSPIEVHVIVEPTKARDSPVRKASSLLKIQSIQRKMEEVVAIEESIPEEKKAKIEKNNARKHEKKKSSFKNINEKSRQLPVVQSVETITRPVTVAAKLLVAEVTPTLSTVFSPTHYAPSCCPSVEESEIDFDTHSETLSNRPNQMNWRNVSPPLVLESAESFLSEISTFKTAPANLESNQPQQSTIADFRNSDLMNMFNPQPNIQSFF